MPDLLYKKFPDAFVFNSLSIRAEYWDTPDRLHRFKATLEWDTFKGNGGTLYMVGMAPPVGKYVDLRYVKMAILTAHNGGYNKVVLLNLYSFRDPIFPDLNYTPNHIKPHNLLNRNIIRYELKHLPELSTLIVGWGDKRKNSSQRVWMNAFLDLNKYVKAYTYRITNDGNPSLPNRTFKLAYIPFEILKPYP